MNIIIPDDIISKIILYNIHNNSILIKLLLKKYKIFCNLNNFIFGYNKIRSFKYFYFTKCLKFKNV